MMVRVVAHKFLALGAGFLNVVFAAAVLDTQSSVFYLTSFSFIQILMAFAGFGVAHKLVSMEDTEALRHKTWPWFFLSSCVGAIALGIQTWFSEAPEKYPIFAFMMLAQVLIVLSEWIRCAIARFTGFLIYNVLIAVVALSILFFGEFNYLNVGFAITAIALLLYLEFRGIPQSGKLLSPGIPDLVRAFRIASLNQYYNIVIYLFAAIANPSLDLITIILVYRFNIFFNWQSFYWLRFGHKKTANGVSPELKSENIKTIFLNFAAIGSISLVVLVVFQTGLLDRYDFKAFDRSFMYLLLLYGWTRVILNLMFPYELFLIYGTDLKIDLRLVLISCLSFLAIALAAIFLHSLVGILLFVEIIWFIWRFYSMRVLSDRTPAFIESAAEMSM